MTDQLYWYETLWQVFVSVCQFRTKNLIDSWCVCKKTSSSSECINWGNQFRYPLQDEQHSGNGLHSIPGFLGPESGLIAEQFRIAPGLMSSKEIRLTLTERPEFYSVLLKSSDNFFCHAVFCFLWHPSNIVLSNYKNGCVLWLFVPKLPSFSCSSVLPFWKKNLGSSRDWNDWF